MTQRNKKLKKVTMISMHKKFKQEVTMISLRIMNNNVFDII
jgi:hypothetical protein